MTIFIFNLIDCSIAFIPSGWIRDFATEHQRIMTRIKKFEKYILCEKSPNDRIKDRLFSN